MSGRRPAPLRHHRGRAGSEKIGTWFIPAVQPQDGATCTSHVLRVYPEQEMLTIAWYAQGVRVLDISGLADVEVAGERRDR